MDAIGARIQMNGDTEWFKIGKDLVCKPCRLKRMQIDRRC